MDAILLRVQDSEGRGPYRPGFSHRWSDPDGPDVLPWWIEIGEPMERAIGRMNGPYHWGCGFRTHAQFEAWFSHAEQRRLDRLGFHLVTIAADIIVAETPTQVVFGAMFPLTNVLRHFRLGSQASRAAA